MKLNLQLHLMFCVLFALYSTLHWHHTFVENISGTYERINTVYMMLYCIGLHCPIFRRVCVGSFYLYIINAYSGNVVELYELYYLHSVHLTYGSRYGIGGVF